MYRLHHRQFGFSLIELMTAMVISLLLLTAAVGVFISNNRIYREQNEMGQLQENARFAMSLLVKDIRSAAFVGCADNINRVASTIPGATDQALTSFRVSATSNLIEGSENGGNWQPSSSTSAVADMITTTDAIPSDGITVRYFGTLGTRLALDMVRKDVAIATDPNAGLNVLDHVVIADCGSADIFRISSSLGISSGVEYFQHAPSHNTTIELSKQYTTIASVYRLANRRYFIRNSASGSGPALWRESVDDGMEELVEGVESMQILYGEDTNNDSIADTYVNATSVSNWSNVVSVKLGLLVRTVQPFGDSVDTNTYNLLGTVINPVDDKRRRRIFTSTIEIRNRKS